MSSSTTKCAACKRMKRKCTQDCLLAPYFPANQPRKFASVKKVFGASHVAKLLIAIPRKDRADTVESLAYQADARLRDPIYGCVGFISVLQKKLKQLQGYIANSKQELATYVGPSGMMPTPGYMAHQHQSNPYSTSGVTPYNMSRMIGPSSAGAGPSHGNALVIRCPKQSAIAVEAWLIRSYEQQWLISQQLHAVNNLHPQQEFASGSSAGFYPDGPPSHFIQTTTPGVTSAVLGGIDNNPYQIQQQQPQQEHLPYHQHHHSQLQAHHLLQPQQQLQQEQLPRHQHHHPQLQNQHLLQSDQLQLRQPHQQYQQQQEHQNHHRQLQAQHLLQLEQRQPHHKRSGSDQGRSLGPSS